MSLQRCVRRGGMQTRNCLEFSRMPSDARDYRRGSGFGRDRRAAYPYGDWPRAVPVGSTPRG